MASRRLIVPSLILVFLLAPAAPPQSDFDVAASPSSLEIMQGSLGISTITLTSLFSFEGTVDLTASISPVRVDGPTFSLDPSTVFVPARGSGTASLTVRTSAATPLGTYSVTVTGASGSQTHSVEFFVNVATVPPSPAVGGLTGPDTIGLLAPFLGLGLAVSTIVVASVAYSRHHGRPRKQMP